MNKRYFIFIATALALGSIGFYYYKKRKELDIINKRINNITDNYEVFN
jgi:hypothetical protein